MSADPINDGLREGLSIYGYCRNNPLMYKDPTGLAGTGYDPNINDHLNMTTTLTPPETQGDSNNLKDNKPKDAYPSGKSNPNTYIPSSSNNTNSNESSNLPEGTSNNVREAFEKYGKVTTQYEEEYPVFNVFLRINRTDTGGSTFGKGKTQGVISNGMFKEVITEIGAVTAGSSGKLYLTNKYNQNIKLFYGISLKGLVLGKKDFNGSNGFYQHTYTISVNLEHALGALIIIGGVLLFTGNIAENIVSGGAGLADDAILIPLSTGMIMGGLSKFE